MGISTNPHGRSKLGLYVVQYNIRIIYIAAHSNRPYRQSEQFSESHGRDTGRPNLETHNSLIARLHHFLSRNRRTSRAPTRSFSKVQRHQSRNQSIQMLAFPSESTLLGHIVSREGIQANPEKTSTVNKHPVPKSATEVKIFLGLCSYYARYVQDFSKMARPLHQPTEKSKDLFWNSEARKHLKF